MAIVASPLTFAHADPLTAAAAREVTAMTGNRSDRDARSFAKLVVARLRDAGFEAYWAGGCVRDLLLQQSPKDFDVATSATPPQVRRLFERTVHVGESFGVIRVLGPPGIEVEVATFREDASYSDGRRPDAVTFSTARADAERRDFTINGIFFDPISEQVLDFVGGRTDLRDGVIRAIGDPNLRFAEDKLRLLRAVRFAARLGYGIEQSTADALRQSANTLGVVSAERILAEFRLMLTPPSRIAALELLRQYRLFDDRFGRLADFFSDDAVWGATIAVMAYWDDDISVPLAFAGLLSQREDGVIVTEIKSVLRNLRASNDERDRAVWLAANRRAFDTPQTKRLCILKRLFAHPGCAELMQYHEALRVAAGNGASDTAWCRDLLTRLTAAEINPPPLITGDDLITLGVKPGPQFRHLLEHVRDCQLDGLLESREQALDAIQRQIH